MEFLKELFGNEALTFDQLSAKVTEKKMKLADLSTGAYVGKDKYDTLLTDRDGLKTRLEEANGKLSGYDPEWKEKAAQAQLDADNKIKAMQRSQVLKEQSASIKFSSESARKAFISDLEAKNFPVEDGKVIGFEEFLKSYKEMDPNAFAPDKPAPTITVPGQGTPQKPTVQQYLDNKYGKNPYYKKGE
jgi:hypothetical protein